MILTEFTFFHLLGGFSSYFYFQVCSAKEHDNLNQFKHLFVRKCVRKRRQNMYWKSALDEQIEWNRIE